MTKEFNELMECTNEFETENGTVEVSTYQVLDTALPIITGLMSKGMTLQDIAHALDSYIEEPWRQKDYDESRD